MRVLSASFKADETTIVMSAAFDALDTLSQLDILKDLIGDLRAIYSDKMKEWRVVKPIKTQPTEVKQRENIAMYLRMEGRTYKAVGETMGISQERVRQILLNYERHCRREAQKQIPYAQEVAALRPHIDSIKAIYEK
jgi:DNA-directed RNA polymerase specialized sigma subunit